MSRNLSSNEQSEATALKRLKDEPVEVIETGSDQRQTLEMLLKHLKDRLRKLAARARRRSVFSSQSVSS